MSSNSSTDEKRLSKTTMAHIWVKMIALYGYKWIKPNGELPLDEKGELTELAATWQSALVGISGQQVADALKGLLRTLPEWPPAAIEFRRLCVSRDDVPTVERIMNLVINAAYAQGSIADRYKHPLAWAVAQHKDLDKHNLKTATTKQALVMITPIYAEILHSGYPQFTESDYEVRLAIEKKKTPQNEINAKKHLSSLRGALKVEVTKPDSFKATEDYKIPDAVLNEMRCEAVAMSEKFKVEVA